MTRFSSIPLLALTLVIWTAFATLSALPVAAQTDAASSAPALPQAPGAERAASSQAPASLPGAPGLSPLEPYLITWLLPVAGIICAGSFQYVDKRLRGAVPRR